VVVVGTNDDWETEGRDRDDMDLPGEQAELIRAVAAANPRTVVVVNAGSPVTTDWADDVGAVVMAWFGGQEMGPALADVLTGRTEPSGRLPLTFPRRLEHNPSYVNFPGENGQVRYGESVFVGYRHYDATDRDPAFCFGHGGSYTAFELSAPRPAAERVAVGSPVTVAVDVTNTGDRRGAQVVQAYVEPVAPRLARPPRELAAFAKVWLDPGASTRVELVLDERAFAYWDPGDPSFAELTIGSIVPTGGGAERRTDPGWYVDPGTYVIRTGTSSRDLPGTATVELH
jgi:beta-glucosidase